MPEMRRSCEMPDGQVEEDTGTFCFIASTKDHQDQLLIFGWDKEGRSQRPETALHPMGPATEYSYGLYSYGPMGPAAEDMASAAHGPCTGFTGCTSHATRGL